MLQYTNIVHNIYFQITIIITNTNRLILIGIVNQQYELPQRIWFS